MFLTPDLSSSESEEELSSPSYASFLHFDQKPVYSDVVKKQMVIVMYCIWIKTSINYINVNVFNMYLISM